MLNTKKLLGPYGLEPTVLLLNFSLVLQKHMCFSFFLFHSNFFIMKAHASTVIRRQESNSQWTFTRQTRVSPYGLFLKSCLILMMKVTFYHVEFFQGRTMLKNILSRNEVKKQISLLNYSFMAHKVVEIGKGPFFFTSNVTCCFYQVQYLFTYF